MPGVLDTLDEKRRLYRNNWQRQNKEKVKQYQKKYRDKQRASPNKPKKARSKEDKDRKKKWQQLNPDKVKAYRAKWLSKPENREWVRVYEKDKRESDLNFKLSAVLRCRVRAAMRGLGKKQRATELLGCSIESFKMYLESKFEEGMNWENYGSFWEIDHIIPCAIFSLSKESHQQRCFHFSNHQPLEVSANRKKHKKCRPFWDLFTG